MKKLNVMTTLVMTMLLSAATMVGCSCRYETVTLAGVNDEQHFAVSEFTKLNVHSALEVVVCDSVIDMVVTTDRNLLPYLQISQSGKSLSIGYPCGLNWIGNASTHVLLPSQKALQDLAISGASQVTIERTIDASEIDIDLSGASVLNADIAAQEADINLSGSSVANLQGSITRLEVGISGASQLVSEKSDDQYLLRANDIKGTLSGSSHLYVHSDGAIRCNVSGASVIFYTGTATTADSDCTGASTIVHE